MDLTEFFLKLVIMLALVMLCITVWDEFFGDKK